MARLDEEYPPFQGIAPIMASYEMGGEAPGNHVVFKVPTPGSSAGWNRIARQTLEYRQKHRHSGLTVHPRMTLLFPQRGTVFVDHFDDQESLYDAIGRVMRFHTLVSSGNHYTHLGLGFGVIPTVAGGADFELLFDIDPQAPGRMIAAEALRKHDEIRDRCERMTLRWPNGGTVMVDLYRRDDCFELGNLSEAIQRARRMHIPTVAAVA